MKYLPDIIERMEMAAESAYDEMVQPDGRFKCSCGNLFSEDEGEVLSPNPYAMPSCPKCCEGYFKSNE